MDTVPQEMAEQLRAMAGPDGLLPPWHEWFPPEVVAELVPDAEVRARFCADVPRCHCACACREPRHRL